jgi:nicotinamidase/pyrazinamidase
LVAKKTVVELVSNKMKTLIISDFQNDFHPSGMAAVKGSQLLTDQINSVIDDFELVVATQFFYPADHIIFAGNHLWRKPNQRIQVGDFEIELMEMHCVANSFGAELMMGLATEKIEKIIQKGTNKAVPSKNGFYELDGKSTGLNEFLKERQADELHFAGIDFNENLSLTILEAQKLGYKVNIIKEACLSNI